MLRFALYLLITLLAVTPTQVQADIILYSLSYSPDGNYVAGVGNRVVIWDAATGNIVADIAVPLQTPVTLLFDAAWSPDGNRLAVAGDDGGIRILDLSDDAQPFGALLTEFRVMTFLDVRSIAWSPDGSLIVIGGDGTRPRLEFWDASTYEFLWESAYVVGADRMAWHPDPQRNLIAVTYGDLNGVQLADTTEDASSSPMWLCSDCAPGAVALPLAWNSNGALLAIGHNDGSIFIVDTETDTVVTSMQTSIGVSGLLWTHDDQHIISMSRAGLQIWNSMTGDLLYAPPVIQLSRIAMHPFKDQIFYFDSANALGVPLDLSTLIEPAPTFTRTPTATLNLNVVWAQTTDPVILDVAWSPTGDMIAMIDDGGTLNVTLSDQVTPVFQFARPVMLRKAAVEWSPQGDRLAVGIGNRMYIWDVVAWQLLHDYEVGLPRGFFTWGPIENIPEGVETITWSTDGRYVVVGTYSYETSVWDTEESQLIFREGDLSGGGPGRVWLDHEGWMGNGSSRLNAFTGELLLPSMEDNQHAFGGSAEGGTTEPRPDNTQIAWGNDTGFLLIIDLNTTRGIKGFEVTESIPPARRRGISDISWDGTWNFIAAASRDGELYVVDLMAGEVTSLLKLDGRITAVDWNPQTNEIIYAGVSESGQSILTIVDVSNIVDGPSDTPTTTFTPTPTATLNLSAVWAQTSDAIVLDVAWSPSGDMIAMIDDSGTLNVTLSDQVTPVFQFARSVMLREAALEWSPQSDYLSVGIGNTVFIWDSEDWELIHLFAAGDADGIIPYYETEIPEGIVNIRWSTDSRYVVTGSLSYITTVWSMQDSQMIYQSPDGSGGGPGRVWLDDNGWLSDGQSKLNVFTEEIVRPSPAENPYIFGGSAEGGTTEPRPDNTQIAWGTAYGILGVIDLDHLNTIQGIRITANDPSMPSRGISDISWDGTWNFIAAASRDGELYVIDLAASEVTSLLKLDGRITAVDWNPQTNEILYAGVSESGQPILSIVDVSGVNGVQR